MRRPKRGRAANPPETVALPLPAGAPTAALRSVYLLDPAGSYRDLALHLQGEPTIADLAEAVLHEPCPQEPRISRWLHLMRALLTPVMIKPWGSPKGTLPVMVNSKPVLETIKYLSSYRYGLPTQRVEVTARSAVLAPAIARNADEWEKEWARIPAAMAEEQAQEAEAEAEPKPS